MLIDQRPNPLYLDVRDELRQLLLQDYSVNLVVNGDRVAWRAMIQHLATSICRDRFKSI